MAKNENSGITLKMLYDHMQHNFQMFYSKFSTLETGVENLQKDVKIINDKIDVINHNMEVAEEHRRGNSGAIDTLTDYISDHEKRLVILEAIQ